MNSNAALRTQRAASSFCDSYQTPIAGEVITGGTTNAVFGLMRAAEANSLSAPVLAGTRIGDGINVRNGTTTDIEMDTGTDMETETGMKIERNMQTEISIGTDTGMERERNMKKDMRPDTGMETEIDIGTDMRTDIKIDTQALGMTTGPRALATLFVVKARTLIFNAALRTQKAASSFCNSYRTPIASGVIIGGMTNAAFGSMKGAQVSFVRGE